jgi:ketosteroid isomerase-like protein
MMRGEEDVRAAYKAWDEAFNKGDASALSAFYVDDAVFLPATHDVVEGPAGVEKFFARLFDLGVTRHRLELIKAGGEGDIVYGTAKWSASGKDASGEDQPWGGIATHIFQRQADGGLKLLLHTFN